MLLELFLLVLLFAAVVGVICGFEQMFARQAAWAFGTFIVSAVLVGFLLPHVLQMLGLIYTLIIVLLIVMRLGMEQVDDTAGVRRKGLQTLPLNKLFERLDAAVAKMDEASPKRRLYEAKILDIPGMPAVWRVLQRMLPGKERFEDLREDATLALRDATTAVVDVHHSPFATWTYRICGGLVVLLCILKIVLVASGRDAAMKYQKQLAAIDERTQNYNWVTARYVGEYLAGKYPGSKALMINGMIGEHEAEAYALMLRGLTEGFSDKVELVAEQPIPWSDASAALADVADGPPPKEQDPLAGSKETLKGLQQRQRCFSAKMLDEWLGRFENCDIVVSNAGLPPDYAELEIWSKAREARPKLVLWRADPRGLKGAIAQGYISAIVTVNPQAQGKPVSPSGETGYRDVFEARFLLIDADNVDSVAKDYPELMLGG